MGVGKKLKVEKDGYNKQQGRVKYKHQVLFQSFSGHDYCAQWSVVSFVEKIHWKQIKTTPAQKVQANEMPFFQKMCPQKMHSCPQCLEQAQNTYFVHEGVHTFLIYLPSF